MTVPLAAALARPAQAASCRRNRWLVAYARLPLEWRVVRRGGILPSDHLLHLTDHPAKRETLDRLHAAYVPSQTPALTHALEMVADSNRLLEEPLTWCAAITLVQGVTPETGALLASVTPGANEGSPIWWALRHLRAAYAAQVEAERANRPSAHVIDRSADACIAVGTEPYPIGDLIRVHERILRDYVSSV